MIFTTLRTNHDQFSHLLNGSVAELKAKAQRDPDFFSSITPAVFEETVLQAMEKEAVGTPFHRKIKLVSGLKFPDIVAKKLFGVEVKSTKADKWKTVGNSVLEATRIDGVETIYLLFGKLRNPFEVKCRKYEECLYDIAVTHHPRYLIDMELGDEDTIFTKMEVPYDKLREQKKPIRTVTDYYKSITEPGEEPWWIDSSESEDHYVGATVKLWHNLPKEMRKKYIAESFARFPEILGDSQRKYERVVSWLVRRYGVIDPSFRDKFSAGSKVNIYIANNEYKQLPTVFKRFYSCFDEVIQSFDSISLNPNSLYWHESGPVTREQLIQEWTDIVIQNAYDCLGNQAQFIVDLFSEELPDDQHSEFLKEERARYLS